MSWALANSLPSPTVVFPQDLLEKGLEADNFAMLGLGDIVIPGDRAGVGGVVPGSRRAVKQTASPGGKEKGNGGHVAHTPGSARDLVKESTSINITEH